jgi:hypothetical protein
MALRQAGMVNGANAKIKLGGKTLAYAVDFQYNVETSVVPVEVIGRVEVISHEPIAMSVGGSFTIARYTKAMVDVNRTLKDAAAGGNGVGKLAAGSAADGDMSGAFNPAKVFSSSTVDIVIYQRKPGADGSRPAVDFDEFMKITDCRLTRLSGSLNKRGILQETYGFVGVMYDDESFDAGETTTGTDLS